MFSDCQNRKTFTNNLCVNQSDVRWKQIKRRIEFTNRFRWRKLKRQMMPTASKWMKCDWDFLLRFMWRLNANRIRTFYFRLSIFFWLFSYNLLLVNGFDSIGSFGCNIRLLAYTSGLKCFGFVLFILLITYWWCSRFQVRPYSQLSKWCMSGTGSFTYDGLNRYFPAYGLSNFMWSVGFEIYALPHSRFIRSASSHMIYLPDPRSIHLFWLRLLIGLTFDRTKIWWEINRKLRWLFQIYMQYALIHRIIWQFDSCCECRSIQLELRDSETRARNF